MNTQGRHEEIYINLVRVNLEYKTSIPLIHCINLIPESYNILI